MGGKLVEFDRLVEDAVAQYGKDRVHVISTAGYDLSTNPKGRNSRHDRRDWADKIVKDLYNIERSQIEKANRKLSSGEYSFAYVKFAEDSEGNVYGIVNGKSSFHVMYPSDVWFYELTDDDKKEASRFMMKNNMKWHVDKILIVLNNDPKNHRESYKTEKELNQKYKLYN